MSEKEDWNLFTMLGRENHIRKAKGNQGGEKHEEKGKADLFVDEEIQDPKTQLSSLIIKVSSVIILIIAVAGLGALGYGLWGSQPEQAPQMMRKVIDRELTGEQKEIKVSKNTIVELKELVTGYLAATTIHEKNKYVRHPERVRPLMLDWYETRKHVMHAKTLDPLMTLVPISLSGKSFWKAEMASGGKFKKELWIQAYDDGLYAIDWETDVFYNPMPWDEYLEKKPTVPMVFRAYLRLDDLYLFQHRDKDIFQSFRITNQGSDMSMAAYMKRDDPGFKVMMFYVERSAKDLNDLSSLPALPFFVSLRFDESPEGKKNLVIEELVSPSTIVLEEWDYLEE